jgi:hypothetical protein
MSDELAKDTAALLQRILEHTERARVEELDCMASLSPCFELMDQLVGKLCEASRRRYVLVMADQDVSGDAQMLCVSGSEGNQRQRESTIDLLHAALDCTHVKDEPTADVELN